jgi:hypothetical protein
MFKKVFLFVVLVALLLTSCAPAVAQFVDLPDEVEGGITAVVVWAISWLFVQLITLVPFLKFLEEFKMPLALALSAQLIALIENAVPDAFGGVAIAGIVLVLTILALFGVGEVLRKRETPGFRSR